MAWSDYWGALNSRQRMGLLAAVALLIVCMGSAALWLAQDPWVPLADHLNGDRLAELAQQLDRAKLPYRASADGEAIEVARSDLGRARVAAVTALSGQPSEVGLELFKETDFSTTDFAQRINYQRALQGELVRTIQGMAGVRNVRVHVVLPEAGLFRRDAARASAAVSIAMQPGRALGLAQVRGIQRLVAASVPEIRLDDVVVLDESGTSLTRASAGAEGEGGAASLDIQRQVDQYLEAKLQRLLQDLAPQGTVSLSVDADVDARQLRITTDEPLAASAPQPGDHPAGVLAKERQSQRGHAATATSTTPAPDAPDPDSAEWENEYKVGHRLEQILSAPGTVRHLSVAVVLQGAPASLTRPELEQLVGHAVGLKVERGDAVDVLMLEAAKPDETPNPASAVHRAARADVRAGDSASWRVVGTLDALLLGAVALVAAVAWRRRAPLPGPAGGDPAELDEVVLRVRRWLAQGAIHARD